MMADWILIIAIGNAIVGGVGDVKHVRLTEAQCKATVVELYPIQKGGIGAVCVAPDGEAYSFDDVQRAAPE